MSKMTLETILCDFSEHCEAEPPHVNLHVRFTREEAAREGWTIGEGYRFDGSTEILDFCPEHSTPEAKVLWEQKVAAVEVERQEAWAYWDKRVKELKND